MTLFWILWTFNALVALVPLYFFVIGLGDGSITSRNMMIWMFILLAVVIVVAGTLWLKSIGKLSLARTLLMIAAVPGIFALIFYGIIIIGKPRWN